MLGYAGLFKFGLCFCLDLTSCAVYVYCWVVVYVHSLFCLVLVDSIVVRVIYSV